VLLVNPGTADARKDDSKVPFVDFPQMAIFRRLILLRLCIFIGRPQDGLLNRQDPVASLSALRLPPCVMTNPLVALVVGPDEKKDQMVFRHDGQEAVGINQIILPAVFDATFTVEGTSRELPGAFHVTANPLLNDGFSMLCYGFHHPADLAQAFQLPGKMSAQNDMAYHDGTSHLLFTPRLQQRSHNVALTRGAKLVEPQGHASE